MKTSSRRAWISVTVFIGLAALAQAHPGHDDGHELTWDVSVSHLTQHPYATVLGVTVLGAAVWLGLQAIRRRGGASVQSLRGSHSNRGK